MANDRKITVNGTEVNRTTKSKKKIVFHVKLSSNYEVISYLMLIGNVDN